MATTTVETATNGQLAVAPTTEGEPVTSTESHHSADSSLHSDPTPSQSNVTATPAASSHTSIAPLKEEDAVTPSQNGPLKSLILKPTEDSKPPPQVKLSQEQKTKYASVLAGVLQWQSIPSTSAKGAPTAPLEDYERMWLTRECLLRYLRATKWNTVQALKRLQATLTWRREFGADKFTGDYISPENETGKQLLLGFDREARPCLYLSPGKQNTKMSDRQIHHLSYMLDRMVDLMPPGQESACLLINFKGSANGNIPTVGQARTVLNILQGHSPERLGKALISETPWYVSTFFRLISPFIDPVTKEKMKFNVDQTKYVPPQQLWKTNGGELDFEYDHAQYWPGLVKECETRRQAYRERWEQAGKRIGEYEVYLRGGDHPSLQELSERAGIAVDAEQDVNGLATELSKLSV